MRTTEETEETRLVRRQTTGCRQWNTRVPASGQSEILQDGRIYTRSAVRG